MCVCEFVIVVFWDIDIGILWDVEYCCCFFFLVEGDEYVGVIFCVIY